MFAMKRPQLALVGLLLLCGLLLVAWVQISAADQAADVQPAHRASFKLPKVFDFARFKSNFRKMYDSSLEEMVRMKLFLARSYRAFISAVKYKHRQASYYLAVNQRSDWTPVEWAASENRFLAEEAPPLDTPEGEFESVEIQLRDEDEAEEELPREALEQVDVELMTPEQLEAELAHVEAHSGEPGFGELAAELRKMRDHLPGARRRRRSVGGAVRDFDVAEALERAPQTSREGAAKPAPPASNNPSYEPPELVSMGAGGPRDANKWSRHPQFRASLQLLAQEGERRDYSHLPVKGKYKTVSWSFNFWSLFGAGGNSDKLNVSPGGRRSGGATSGGSSEATHGEGDVVWVDHSKSECMPEVQDQGSCGSCYAFAVLAFFEHAYCRETSKRVKFSEQYALDCGGKLGLHGCSGGRVDLTGDFFANFGLELASHYPYRARREMCPYSPEADLPKMGYLKLNMPFMSIIPVENFETYLKFSPMVITINTEGDFQEYGGGVWDGRECTTEQRHAVLLVGHGREDGEEYWLIRNSYSTDWGERGHFRLNKNSNCIHLPYGRVWGSTNGGERIRLAPERNKHVPKPLVKSRKYYLKNFLHQAEAIKRRVTGAEPEDEF